MNRLIQMMVYLVMVCALTGCSVISKTEKKKNELEFTVVEKDDIPDEMKVRIEQRKEEPFQITYGDQEYLYIGQGYGEQQTSGYSIKVDACYEAEHAIYVHTSLIGPKKEEEISETFTCPYVVVRVTWSEKQVIFQGI